MNVKTKRTFVILSIIVVLIIGAITILIESVKTKTDKIQIQNVDITTVEDGTYQGEYTLTPVIAKVEIVVKDKKIQTVRLIEHQTALGKDAEQLTGIVVEKQRIDVDVVAGATTSSKAILKAIENALTK